MLDLAKSTYDKNMAALKGVSTELAKWVEDQPEVDWIRQDGAQLFVQANGWKPCYDLDDPLKGLDDLITTSKPEKERVNIFVGTGLGHAIYKLVEKAEKGHHIIAFEPTGYMIRLMLSYYDFSTAIKDKVLLIAPTDADAEALIGTMEGIKVVEDWGLFIDRTCNERHEYRKATERVLEIINSIQCNTGTVMSAGAKIADNDIATLPYVIRHRGVKELVDLYKGKPAVLVCTGPSLSRNIHLLKEAQDRVVIVAVAQALRPLLAHDIRPDFICTVDFGEVNMTHLAGLLDEDVPLVTINKAYAPLVKEYRGPKFISASINQGMENTAHGILHDRGELAQGGSVAHMGLSLCASMGCSAIMLMGMDQALSDGASHSPLADSGGKVEIVDGRIKWTVNDPRSKTLHAREDISMGPVVYSPGWWGEPVLTNTGLQTFLTATERLIAQATIPILDCTEGGARKKGSKRMFLIDALAEYAKESFDKREIIAPLLTVLPDADERIQRAVPLLRTDLKLLDICIEQSELALKTVIKLRNMNSSKKLLALFHENAKHSQAAHEAAKRLPTVALAIYGASRAIQGRSMNVESDAKKLCTKAFKKERLVRVDRNEFILKAARDASKELKKTYEETLGLLLDYLNGAEPIGDPDAPNLEDAEHYLASGNFAKPLLEARRGIRQIMTKSDNAFDNAIGIINRAIRIRSAEIEKQKARLAEDIAARRNVLPRYFDLMEEALELGRDHKKFDEALAKLKEASELFPEKKEARWGIASAYNQMEGRSEEAVVAYEALVRDFPEEPRFEFELGQALVKADRLEEGVERITSAMKRSPDFDHFNGTLGHILAAMGQKEQAREAWEKHLASNPHDEDIRNALKITI